MTESERGVTNLLSYCASLAQEFSARQNRVQAFVRHNLTSGTANEAILRDFLSSISAEVFSVSEGFICNPIKGTSSKQCDILVYDNRFPLVYAESGVKIVWPESVLSVIEVKTTMKGKDTLRAALDNIIAAKQTDSIQHIIGLIFAFNSLAAETALQVLSEYPCEPSVRPSAIILFDQGIIIQQPDILTALRYGSGNEAFEVRQCKGKDPSALALTYMLLLFLWAEFLYSPGFSSTEDVATAIRQFVDLHTSAA